MHDIISIPDVIARKRNGVELADDEIQAFINGVVNDSVSGPQIGAFLMSVYFRGMSTLETGALLSAMVDSGETMQWPEEWRGLLVDKHSTGGIGDKVSLPLAPALASYGLKVPMISGRGLGITGGTLDKLESIPGYQVSLSTDKIREIMADVGCVIMGQTARIVPADKKLYAIRDVTATTDIMPLIVGSILSKKLAANISSLVMEMTYGKATFMPTEADARDLAKMMIEQGKKHGLKVSAMFTRMDTPMGMMIGNALEVREAIQCLYGKANKELMQTVCKLGGQLLVDTKKATNLRVGETMIERSLRDGTARGKFRDMLVAQGVSPDIADQLIAKDFSCLPTARSVTSLKSHKTGFIHDIDARACGTIVHQLGGGRSKESDLIRYGVGIELTAHVGDCLNEGEEWARIHHDTDLSEEQLAMLAGALDIKTDMPDTPERITGVIV